MAIDWSRWAKPEDDTPRKFLTEVNPGLREVYRIDPARIQVDGNIVALISQGDYRHRQIFELIQNAADAIVEDSFLSRGGRVKVLLTEDGLYCANEGAPFSFEGIKTLTYPIATTKLKSSTKRGNQVGRYGQGFRSVLAVSNEPKIFSQTGSYEYKFQNVVDFLCMHIDDGRPDLDRSLFGTEEHPIVSIFVAPQPIDPEECAENDTILAELMEWATTVIYLPFKSGRYSTDLPPFEHLKRELENFSPEFLIFARHVSRLELEIRDVEHFDIRNFSCVNKFEEVIRIEPITEATEFGQNILEKRVCSIACEGDPNETEWVVFTDYEVDVSSVGDTGVQQNRRRDDDGNCLPVQVSWAVRSSLPAAGRGEFWFHFPTKDWTSLNGILNAPWDTNNERTQVNENPYNTFLVERVAHLVHQAIPFLLEYTFGDFGKIFDVVPARAAEAERIAKILALRVPELAQQYNTIPDLDGALLGPNQLRPYPAKILDRSNDAGSEWARAWGECASAPRNFPHWTCLSSQNRKARLSNWLQPENQVRSRNDK